MRVLIVTLVISTVLASVSLAIPRGRKLAVERTIEAGGLTRTFLVYAPLQAEGRLPLVIVLHGGGSSARGMERYSRFSQLAKCEGFIVCYPESIDKNWNDGRDIPHIRSHRENIDDVEFMREMVATICQDHEVDATRIFATGISNGAFMSHRLAAEASDLIVAVAPVVGGMSPQIAASFDPAHPVSLFVIQGDADPIVPFDGGDVGLPRGKKRGQLLPTQKTLAKYIALDERLGTPETLDLEDKDPNDGTKTAVTVYDNTSAKIHVQFYLVKNGGHTWPGRNAYAPKRIIGKASHDFDASEAIWQFFKRCPARQVQSDD